MYNNFQILNQVILNVRYVCFVDNPENPRLSSVIHDPDDPTLTPSADKQYTLQRFGI